MKTAIIIVDHGSRSEESNNLLVEVAEGFAERFRDSYPIVEPAHMELSEPSIATACARCAERGADLILVCPFFLGPGKHYRQDIPRLVTEALAGRPQIAWRLGAPLGSDRLVLELLHKRAQQSLYAYEEGVLVT